ncbi:MAG TPA: AMP-binding protein [Acidimicrobiales bacterium]|nr:AMP-binding protein [Acidimicrobiales bacterium]
MTSVAQLLVQRAEDETVGLRFGDAAWTWRDVVAQCAAWGSWMTGTRSDGPFHVGVLLENVPEFLFLLGAAALTGATIVGINPTRRGAELAADIRHTDCQVLVTSTELRPLVEGLETGVPGDRVVVVDGPAPVIPAPAAALPPSLPVPETLYLLLFTSGSTGAPKAVKVSQQRLADAGAAMAAGSGFTSVDVLYCAMPMFHGNALNLCVVPAVASGACLVLRRRFSASAFLPDVRRYGVTYFNYVGRALAYILATPPEPDDAVNTLKFAFGTDASPSDMAAFRRRFGCPVIEGYGSSEGAISMSRVPGTPPQALGVPPPGTEVAIVDPATGVECPPAVVDGAGRLLNASEAIGEIISRNGAERFEGYYANDEAEAERTRRGWFWSGDLGYRDAEGFFYFAGRPADWLRVDGENFAASPVERILARFPGVVTAVVYPVPDPRTGDQVMASLELVDPGAFDPEAFARFLAAQDDLGTKWAPRFVRIADHVPLTGTNKVDKRPLRSAAWVTDDPVWWRPFVGRGAGPDDRYRRLTAGDVEALDAELRAHGRIELLAR